MDVQCTYYGIIQIKYNTPVSYNTNFLIQHQAVYFVLLKEYTAWWVIETLLYNISEFQNALKDELRFPSYTNQYTPTRYLFQNFACLILPDRNSENFNNPRPHFPAHLNQKFWGGNLTLSPNSNNSLCITLFEQELKSVLPFGHNCRPKTCLEMF